VAEPLYRRRVAAQVIVLNGGSSAGKSSVARALQVQLPRPWLRFGTDVLGDALPPSGPNAVVTFGAGGEVWVAPGYRALEHAWYRGLAEMAAAGVGLILDEVFLRGAVNQAELAAVLAGLDVVWVGVRCDHAEATAREAARPDRVVGMAAAQAEVVHRGVVYDVEVDTTRASPGDCAQLVLDHVEGLADAGPAAPSTGPAGSDDVATGSISTVSASRFRVVAAVYGILEAEDRVLLMRRAGTGYRDGQLGLPAGHVDGGEDAVAALRRELREELAITVDADACHLALVVHRAPERPGDGEYLDLVFTVATWHGTPVVAEPAKCSELVWVDRRHLPADVIDYVTDAFAAVDRGEQLLLHGWT